MRIARGLPVWSEAHGLKGVCDVVEIHKNGILVPVEYKRGRPKKHRADEIQLCGQAICLEDSFKREPGSIETGYLFYGKQQRRTAVTFDTPLRTLTLEIVEKVRSMIQSGKTPTATYVPGLCNRCSLIQLCQPKCMRLKSGVERWFRQRIETSTSSRFPERPSSSRPSRARGLKRFGRVYSSACRFYLIKTLVQSRTIFSEQVARMCRLSDEILAFCI